MTSYRVTRMRYHALRLRTRNSFSQDAALQGIAVLNLPHPKVHVPRFDAVKGARAPICCNLECTTPDLLQIGMHVPQFGVKPPTRCGKKRERALHFLVQGNDDLRKRRVPGCVSPVFVCTFPDSVHISKQNAANQGSCTPGCSKSGPVRLSLRRIQG